MSMQIFYDALHDKVKNKNSVTLFNVLFGVIILNSI